MIEHTSIFFYLFIGNMYSFLILKSIVRVSCIFLLFLVLWCRWLRALWKHFLLLEDHISAPFRQIMLNAEAIFGILVIVLTLCNPYFAAIAERDTVAMIRCAAQTIRQRFKFVQSWVRAL